MKTTERYEFNLWITNYKFGAWRQKKFEIVSDKKKFYKIFPNPPFFVFFRNPLWLIKIAKMGFVFTSCLFFVYKRKPFISDFPDWNLLNNEEVSNIRL
jgi:hypothetical protein